jgi:uncharacterized membrane protein
MITISLQSLILTAQARALRPHILGVLSTWFFPAWMSWGLCLPYLAGVSLLIVGLCTILSKNARKQHGQDWILSFGPVFFAVPLAVFGIEHFTATKFVVPMVPSWIPGPLFWVYFVGIALIAAALSIAVGNQTRLSATLLGAMILMFEGLMHIPRIVATPGDRIAWTVALRDLAFIGGASALAGAQTEARRTGATHKLVNLARFFIGVPVTIFGVEQFMHPDLAPGVPLIRLTPHWIPGYLLWGYLTGVCFVVTGLALILNKKPRLSATVMGLIILFLVLFIYVPIVAADPSDIGNGLNYLVDTLALCGSALALAEAQRMTASNPKVVSQMYAEREPIHS